MGTSLRASRFVGGLIQFLAISAIAYFIFKPKHTEESLKNEIIISKSWFWKIPSLSIIYMLLFIAFGIMIAYRSEELRNFYAGSISNMSYNDLRIIQIFRGFLWILFTLPILIWSKGKRIEKIISISLMLAILPTILLLFPNPYMPSGVRLTHFVEVFISNGLFGLILGYVLSSLPPSKDENRPPHTSSLRKKSSRKAGGQAGHEGKTLEMTDTPDEIIEHHSCFCPECC